MSEENLNQEEREVEDIFNDESEDSNDSEGKDSEDASTLSDDALVEYNERVGKSYKSWDDIAKREKEADKAFAKGEHKKEETVVKDSPSVNDEVIEELLLTKHPEAEYVMDELKDVSKQTGKSMLKLFRESKYFQGEAKSLADAKQVQEESKSKINKPTSGAGSPKKDFSNVKTSEDVANLSDKEKVDFFNHQVKKEQAGQN
jgi:hypothetical protein